jgi:CheY-like chemotaxis protein
MPVSASEAPLVEDRSVARILVIDDEENVRTLFALVLERAGHDVVGAANGAEGLGIQRETPADLVVTDLVMPEKEGLETITELRREYPALKILAVSGGGRNQPRDYLRTAGHLGADRTLAKPVNLAEFVDVVTELLEAGPS